MWWLVCWFGVSETGCGGVYWCFDRLVLGLFGGGWGRLVAGANAVGGCGCGWTRLWMDVVEGRWGRLVAGANAVGGCGCGWTRLWMDGLWMDVVDS